MPIKPEFRKFYRGPEWQAVRARIRERAGDCCEQCGLGNGWLALRVSGYWWDIARYRWRSPDKSELLTRRQMREMCALHRRLRRRWVHIVCTVAHLNHVPGDDRDENLKFLCQWCHLNYDKLHHRETRQIRKDAARPLLQEAI